MADLQQELRQALGDPGSFLPRGDDYQEHIIDWQQRAVLQVLRSVPIEDFMSIRDMERVEATTSGSYDLGIIAVVEPDPFGDLWREASA
jgi:hypothetical protein